MDTKRVSYDLAMLYTQEVLRRMDGSRLNDFVQTAPKVKETFDMVYEILSGTLPGEEEM